MTETAKKNVNKVEENLIVSLKTLLEAPYNTHYRQLVRAIENHGIYTKDKFGIFKNYPYISSEGERALDLLSFYMDYEQKDEKAFSIFDSSLKSPLVEPTRGANPSEYHDYGWPEDKLPNFSAINSKQIDEKPLLKRERQGYIRTISVLLKYIRGGMSGVKKHPDFRSDAQLILDIEAEFYKNNNGLSERSLQKKFSDANNDNLFK